MYQEKDLNAKNIARVVIFAIEAWEALWLVRNQPNQCSLQMIEIKSVIVQGLKNSLINFSVLVSTSIILQCFSVNFCLRKVY